MAVLMAGLSHTLRRLSLIEQQYASTGCLLRYLVIFFILKEAAMDRFHVGKWDRMGQLVEFLVTGSLLESLLLP
jgi:hypothetical protein